MNTHERYWRIENGDVLEMLATMEDESFDGLLMDSPYGLTFMEKKWDEALPSVQVFQELLRVCKPGAMLMAFGSPKTHHRLACHIEDAGWEVRDCLMWLYGEGFPKGLDISKAIDKKLGAKREVIGTKPNPHRGVRADHQYGFQAPDTLIEITAPATPQAALWDGYGTALKPAWEPILVAMKPLDGTFAENALAWGCGGLNIRGMRIGGTVTTNPLVRNAKGYGSDGLIQGSTGKGVVSEGRRPANVLPDKDAAELLDRQGPVSKSRRSARRMYASNVGNGKTMKPFKSRLIGVGGYDDEGGPSRFFYCPKASKRERNAGLDGLPIKRPDTRSESGMGHFKEAMIESTTRRNEIPISQAEIPISQAEIPISQVEITISQVEITISRSKFTSTTVKRCDQIRHVIDCRDHGLLSHRGKSGDGDVLAFFGCDRGDGYLDLKVQPIVVFQTDLACLSV